MKEFMMLAVSGGRKVGKDGRCKTPVGSTVDLKTATYKNTIGDAVLTSTWVDPDFDPSVSELLLRTSDRDSNSTLDCI